MLFMLGVTQSDVASSAEISPDDATLANTLVVVIPQDIQTFDPFAVNEVAGESLVRALFDNLLERDLEGNLVPGLATSYRIIDPTTIELTLRQGVTFHNGEVFDARSVVFSVEQLLNPDASYANAGQFSAIDHVEILDDYTVRLHLNRTDASIFDKLTAQLVMVPADYYAEVGAQGFAARPVGTGPFQFVQHTRDVDALLAANPNYWQGSHKGQPEVAFVRFRVIPEPATALAEFQAGNVDIVGNLPADFTPLVSRAGGQVVSRDVPTLNMIWFNAFGGELDVLQDSRVRQALNYAVDIETILTTLQGGYGVRLASTLTPLSLGFDDSLEPYPYDPEQARALLEAADFAFDTELSLSVPPNINRTIAEAILSYLEGIGLNVRLQFLDLNAFNDAWLRDSEPAMGALFIASWGGLFDPGSQSFFLASDARASYYSNARVDELLTAAEAELDPDIRASYYQQVAQITHDDPVGIYLWAPASLYGVSSRVEGWQAHPRDFVLVSGTQLITANSQR
ncbi:MAG: ABC transporter substrate-binding protein [Deinococcota bacterium]